MTAQRPQAQTTNRRRLLRSSARSGALLAATVLLQWGGSPTVQAQQGSPIVGSWLVTTTGPTPSIVGIISHAADGVVIQSHPNPLLTDGHGAWVQTGERDYLLTFIYLRRNEQGELVGMEKVRRTVTLDEAGGSFVGAFQSEILDLAGKVERSSSGTVQGTRIVAEPFV